MNPVEEGRVVIPRAGRDKGRLMAVLRVEDEYAYIVDGDLRTMEKPKKKKIKHLLSQKAKLEGLQDIKIRGTVVHDAQLRAWLCEIGKQGGVNACQRTI